MWVTQNAISLIPVHWPGCVLTFPDALLRLRDRYDARSANGISFHAPNRASAMATAIILRLRVTRGAPASEFPALRRARWGNNAGKKLTGLGLISTRQGAGCLACIPDRDDLLSLGNGLPRGRPRAWPLRLHVPAARSRSCARRFGPTAGSFKATAGTGYRPRRRPRHKFNRALGGRPAERSVTDGLAKETAPDELGAHC